MGSALDAELLARAVRNPGRLALGPTTVSGAFPFGGISLGLILDDQTEIVWHSETIQVRDPASGRISEIGRRGVEYPEIYCLIDGPSWDDDALKAIFSRPSVPANNQPAEIAIGGSVIPVTMQAWPPLLFAPNDPQHKAIYFRRPYPTLSLRQSIGLSQSRKAGLPLRFTPTPDSSSTIPDWQIARMENIQL